MPYDPQRLGRNVKAARGSKTLVEFAVRSGVPVFRLDEFERAIVTPNVETLYKISKAAGVTLAELVEGVDT